MMKVYFCRRLVSFVPASILHTNACDFYTCGAIGSVKFTEKNCLHKPARPQQTQLSTLSGARDVTRPYFLSTVPFKSLTSLTGEKMATKTAILLLADGAEEMEAVITTDVLRRAGVSWFFTLYNLKKSNFFFTNVTSDYYETSESVMDNLWGTSDFSPNNHPFMFKKSKKTFFETV